MRVTVALSCLPKLILYYHPGGDIELMHYYFPSRYMYVVDVTVTMDQCLAIHADSERVLSLVFYTNLREQLDDIDERGHLLSKL